MVTAHVTPHGARTLRVPGGYGASIPVQVGDTIRVVNISGRQVVDFWALTPDHGEHLSMEHNREVLQRLFFRVDDVLCLNSYRPALTIVADTSGGWHDTLIAACSPKMYRDHGIDGEHRSCESNFAEALGAQMPRPPAPWNLFMVAEVDSSGVITYRRCDCPPGSYVDLRAETDLVICVSACPDDVYPTNGGDGLPSEIEVTVRASGRGD